MQALVKTALLSSLALFSFGINASISQAESASDYKSVTQIKQSYCGNYDERGYCTETISQTLGFKNMFPPDKVAVDNGYKESYVREDFRSCDFNGGNYCSYSHQELSTFKMFIPPNTKRANITIFNSQGNTPNTIKFVAIARFDEPPTGDYSHIDPYNIDRFYRRSAEKIEDVTGKDYGVSNSDGITQVFDGGLGVDFKGGWLYVKFVELENRLHGVQSLFIIDSQKYTTWYDNMTTTGSWLSDGDPAQANPATFLPGDLNQDKNVDIFDYNLFLTEFGKVTSGNIADLDQNGKVDIYDYNLLLRNFGKSS